MSQLSFSFRVLQIVVLWSTSTNQIIFSKLPSSLEVLCCKLKLHLWSVTLSFISAWEQFSSITFHTASCLTHIVILTVTFYLLYVLSFQGLAFKKHMVPRHSVSVSCLQKLLLLILKRNQSIMGINYYYRREYITYFYQNY